MSNLSKFSSFLAVIAMVTSPMAHADVKSTIDSLSDLTMEMSVTEEDFSGSAVGLFDTDDCSAFAIQADPRQGVYGYEEGYDYDFPGFPNWPPKKDKPKKRADSRERDRDRDQDRDYEREDQSRSKDKKQVPRKPSDKDSDLGDLAEDLSTLDEVLTAIEKIGTRIWKLVEANRPVVHVESKVANALPRNVSCWMDLENWKVPKVYKYNVTYKNLFGAEVVNFTFRVIYTYGASYEGRGKYLSNVSVHPAELDLLWGYTFNSKVEVQRIINLGTKEEPVAGMEMKLIWQVSTPLKDSQQSKIFFITGAGEVSQD